MKVRFSISCRPLGSADGEINVPDDATDSDIIESIEECVEWDVDYEVVSQEELEKTEKEERAQLEYLKNKYKC